MSEIRGEKDKEIVETLNSILSAVKGLETIKEQFLKHDLFKSAWNFGYTEGFYNLLKGLLTSDRARDYITDENIRELIMDLQNRIKEAQDSMLKALKETEKREEQ